MLNIEQTLQTNYESFYSKYPRFITKGFTSIFKKLLHEEEINNFIAKTPARGISFVDKI